MWFVKANAKAFNWFRIPVLYLLSIFLEETLDKVEYQYYFVETLILKTNFRMLFYIQIHFLV